MKILLKLTCSISLLLTSITLYSQGYANNWHIKDFDMLFNNDSVEIILGSSVNVYKNVGIISDDEGNLLFYSDGHSVWNKNHDVMPNGNDLNIPYGNRSIIIPKPNSESIYYIFTVEAWNGQESAGLYYSLVDLSQDNGLGDVITKGVKILNRTSNKITAVYHENEKDVWLITHIFETNNYYSYLISASGISNSPVVSAVGKSITSSFRGQLKASPDGKKIACSYDDWFETNDNFDLFSFDASTGELSWPMSFSLPVTSRGADGIEFSSDATKLFVVQYGSSGESGLYQYDITAGSFNEIDASRVRVSTEMYNSYTVMQLAPNGKIYICKGGGGGGTEHLGVVENPNEYGHACIVHENGLFLNGGSSFVGETPCFIQNYFFKTSFVYDNTCQANPVNFRITNEYKLDSVRWYFGEGSTSTQLNPIFTYNNAGKYTIRMLAYYPNNCDTITKQITINPYTAFDLGENNTVCYGEKISVNEDFESYLWNDGDTVNYNFIEQEGWYKTTVTNSFGCKSSDSIYMSVVDLPSITSLHDTIVLGDQDSVKLDAGEFYAYKWNTGDSSQFIYVKNEGWYSVQVENESGCHASRSVLVLQEAATESEDNNDWKIINPKPTYLTGLDVYFINEKTGFIINNNSLLKTTDSGDSWEKVMTLSSANRIAFKNSIGYITGNGGTIYKSTHEGAGWNKLNTNFTDNLNSITLITEDTIRITSNTNLFSSNNGGFTWEITPINGGIVNDSYFINSNTGHAVCRGGTILKTTDGGKNWITTLSTNTFPSDFFRIVFTNDSIGFATREHNELFRTIDSGETWQKIKSLDAIYDMHFLDEQTGYLSGEYGVIYRTIDGGDNWQYISPTGRIDAYHFYGIFFVNKNEGYATGARGRILKTTNGGDTWDGYAPTYNDINQLDFVSDSIAYALVGNEIYKTTDGGKTIINMGAPLPGEKTRQFDFINELTGYSISGGETGTSSSENSVCKTIDGGKTWTKTHDSYRVMDDLYCLDFIDENTGFVSGGYNQPQLKKTTDGGKTWTTKGESLRFGQIQFINSETGYARNTKNYYHRIYKTIDGGENWEIILEQEEGINSFYFIDELTGFTVGDDGCFFKTIDGGKNWKKLSIPYEYYHYVRFISKNIGFILDEDGKLYITYNGGENWELWTQLYGISSVEIQADNIFIYGTYGKILQNSIPVDSVSLHINPADSITNESAYISGTIASNAGTIDSVFFEYSNGQPFSNVINIDVSIGFDSSAVISTYLSDLKSNTSYSYRLCVVQNKKKYYSNILNFKTLADYEIFLYPVYEYSSDQARVVAQIISRDSTISNIEIQYGVDQAFDNSITALPNSVMANETSIIEGKLVSLEPQTRYYIRLKANYKGKNIYSGTTYFTTNPEYEIDMYSPYRLNEESISISGFIGAYRDSITNFIIQYGKSRIYNQTAEAIPNTIPKGAKQYFECQLNNLDSNTIYFYRPCFVMGFDTIYGNENIFSLNQELDIAMLGVEQLSDSTVGVKAIINSYGKFIQDIKFRYGIHKEFSDSIDCYPDYVLGYNSKIVEATLKGLIPNSEYTIKLSAIYNSNRVYSDSLSFFITGTTDVMEQDILSELEVYPNPTEHFITIKCSMPFSYSELINLKGEVLIKSKNRKIDMTELPPGVYFIKVRIDDRFITRKIIKK